MSKPTITYDRGSNTFRDGGGNVLVDLSTPPPAPTGTDLTQAIAAAFGYSADAAPTILRVGAGGVSDEAAPSRAERDIAAAFSSGPEAGA